jgi:ubiquitin carboxyl-terminal hydrolase 10
MRSPPAYMNYHPPPVNGHVPPGYAQHYPPPWYNGYPQMQPPPPGAPMPPGPPPRPYQPSYAHAPLIVSSYPHSQPVPAPMHVSPNGFPQPQSTASTPIPPTMSPPPAGPTHIPVDNQELPTLNDMVSSPPIAEIQKSSPHARLPFRAPVSRLSIPKPYSNFYLISFYQLPWLSVPNKPFPIRAPHRRRSGRSLQTSTVSVEFPAKDTQKIDISQADEAPTTVQGEYTDASGPGLSEPQTPTTSQAPSESDSTHPTTPSSTAPANSASRSRAQTQTPKQAAPVVPVVPIVPQAPSTPKQPTTPQPTGEGQATDVKGEVEDLGSPSQSSANTTPAAPKSWADLVRSKAASRGASVAPNTTAEAGNLQTRLNESLGDVLTGLGSDVDQYGEKIAFLEPRGLVNTGNLCYMNSVSPAVRRIGIRELTLLRYSKS